MPSGRIAHWENLNFFKIPYPARGIDILVDDISHLLGILSRVYYHASQKLGIFAFLGVSLKNHTCKYGQC